MTVQSKHSDMRISETPKTLRALALERMRAAILAFRFKPGERLTERDLCDQLGVSRSVVREVMRHLEAESLVQTIPHHGVIVAKLDATQAAEIYEIRALFEAGAAHACAERATSKQIAELRRALEGIDKAYSTSDRMAVLAATTRFYEAMFLGAQHPIAWEIVERLNGRISRFRALTISSPARSVTGPAQLRKIYTAIAARNPEAAAQACREHVRSAAKLALEIITAQPELIAQTAKRPRKRREGVSTRSLEKMLD
jgi:GntR family transcriptional regulator, trigonelline degradation regulator